MVAANNKTEYMLQEKHLQSQAQIASIRSESSELQMRTECDVRLAREKVALSEQEALQRASLETMEVATLRASLNDANSRSEALKRHGEDLKHEQVKMLEKLVEMTQETSDMQQKLEAKLAGQTQGASEMESRLREKLTSEMQEVCEVQTELKQAERRFNAAESGFEFMHTELSRQRRDSEQVWKALAVEQKDSSVLRVRVKELETECSGYSGTSRMASITPTPRIDHDSIFVTPNHSIQKKRMEDPGSMSNSLALGNLRQDMREIKGREPLSDMTGNWQRARALEARLNLSQEGKGTSKDEDLRLGDTSPDALPTDRFPRHSGARSNKSFQAVQSPNASPVVDPRQSLKYDMPTSNLKDPDPLAASITSSSSVATRLSGCLSPVDWLVGKPEALESPKTSEVGLQCLGGRSLECSPVEKAQSQSQLLALAGSPNAQDIVGSSPLRGISPLPERRGASPIHGVNPLPECPASRGLRC